MFIHITPKLLHDITYPTCLEEFTIFINDKTFKLTKDQFKIFNPLPDKRILVACVKQRKNITGILFKTDQQILTLKTNAIWQNFGTGTTYKHTVKYKLANNNYDLITNEMILWPKSDNYKNQMPQYVIDIIEKYGLQKLLYLPCMNANLLASGVNDRIYGNIVDREEFLEVPTLKFTEWNIYKTGYLSKLPKLDSAIII